MVLRALILGTSLSTGLMSALFAGSALASPSNVGPPTGAIFDLAGQTVSGSYQTYSIDFTAALASTDITFALRNDPNYTDITNISVVDVSTGSTTNLIVNGTFLGTGNSIDGWTYDNVYGATHGGVAENGYWHDGAVQAYDAIDQFIATVAGDIYRISFDVRSAGTSIYSALSTNGDVTDTEGNGNDVLVYALAALPPPATTVPEPGVLTLLGAGLVGLATQRRRRRSV